MAQQTAMQIMYNELMAHEYTIPLDLIIKCKELIDVEKEHIKDAVIYGLDEDGHTGDWKISVAQNYYNKTFTDGNSGTKAD
jgi:hypothetical protein